MASETPLSLILQLLLAPSLLSPQPKPVPSLTSSVAVACHLAVLLHLCFPSAFQVIGAPRERMKERGGERVLRVVPVGSMNQREAGGAMEELDLLPELLPQPVSLWEYRGCECRFLVRPVPLALPATPASFPACASLHQALTSSPSRRPGTASFLIRQTLGSVLPANTSGGYSVPSSEFRRGNGQVGCKLVGEAAQAQAPVSPPH